MVLYMQSKPLALGRGYSCGGRMVVPDWWEGLQQNRAWGANTQRRGLAETSDPEASTACSASTNAGYNMFA